MNFPKILITIFAALIVIITCLIVGTTYGTRLAVNNRVKEITTEQTCRTTYIKPYEPPSYVKKNNVEGEIEETCTTREKESRTTTIKNRTTAPISKSTSINKQITSTTTTTTVLETSTTEYTTTSVSAATTVSEEQDESSVLSFYELRHFKVGSLFQKKVGGTNNFLKKFYRNF